MATFCTSCGSPLNEGQGFCMKCGAKTGSPQAASGAGAAPPMPAVPIPAAPIPAAAMPPAAAPPVAAPPPAATGGGSGLVKILLIVVGVIFLFGAVAVAGVAYVGYRFRQKAREMGLTSENRRHSPALAGGSVNGCKWLSKEDVSAAIGMTVVRAEPTEGSDPGCSYSVMGEVTDLTVKHAMQLNKEATSQMSPQDQEKMQSISKTMLQGAGSNSAGGHPGEVVVMTFGVDENAAQFQMKLNKGMMGNLSPIGIKDVSDVGDEAFAAAGSMLFVRKNDTLVRFMYTQCPCGTEEIVPLARKVAAAL
jgi:hypothetical protein